jgi:valyl-tRNA synthetase
MIMMGLKFMGEQPFDHVYIHALIRDAEGQKMSKSKGNVIDPLEMTEAFGTDAVRFTLAAYAAQGRDIKFSEERVEGYRHFLNKIWNVARFISMNVDEGTKILPESDLHNSKSLSLADKWIMSRMSGVSRDVNHALDEYRFNDAASLLYQFVWHELCDWYIEMIKPDLSGDDAESKSAAISTLINVYESALALLHPFMPFITEEIWQQLPVRADVESICIRKYPVYDEQIHDQVSEKKMDVIMDAVTGIRSIRGELNISPSLKLKVFIKAADKAEEVLNENMTFITKLARTSEITIGQEIDVPKNSSSAIKPSLEIYVPLKGIIDVDAEITRLNKEFSKAEKDLTFVKKKLANVEFMEKAPEAVVEECRAKHDEYLDKIQAIQENIDKLKELEESD